MTISAPYTEIRIPLTDIPHHFTGVAYDTPFTAKTNGVTETWCAVYEYENGECVDRYVTRWAAVDLFRKI